MDRVWRREGEDDLPSIEYTTNQDIILRKQIRPARSLFRLLRRFVVFFAKQVLRPPCKTRMQV